MAGKFHFQKCLDKSQEIEQVSTISRKKFSFLWTINNFKEYMDRQYEFKSPLFFENLSSSTLKWKMMVYPVNIYPEGMHVAFKLQVLSEIERSYPVMYSISLIDVKGEQHYLKTRDKVFRHNLDFDECPVISNILLKEKCLLSGESLSIRCELDLLQCENVNEISEKACENSDNLSGKSCEISDCTNSDEEKINIPSMIQSVNNLSCSESYKKSVINEKIINDLVENKSFMETTSGESEIQNYKINEGLEILSSDLKQLYYNTNQHDVIIYADDGKCTAHEIILASRSEYFKKALSLQKDTVINIPGLSTDTLDNILYYLYTGRLKKLTENSALDLMKASKLLLLPLLENIAEIFLKHHISAINVTNLYLMSKEMKKESLKNSCLKYIAENHEEVSKTQQWNELMRNNPHSAGEILLTTAYYKNKLVNDA